jgi:hypothetical protein
MFLVAIPALLRRHRIFLNSIIIRKQKAFILAGLLMRLSGHACRPHSS